MTATDLAMRLLADEASDDAYDSMYGDEGRWGDRLRRWAVIGRIVSLLQGTPGDAVPPPPPPPPPELVQTDGGRRGGVRQRPPNRAEAMLEHLGHVAERAEDDATADEALGRMIPLLRRLAGPAAAGAVRRTAPVLRSQMRSAGRILRGNPRSRPFVRALPSVLSGVARRLRRAAASGRPVSARTVIAALASEIGRTLGDTGTARATVRRTRRRPCRHCGARGQRPAAAGRPNGTRTTPRAGSPPAQRHVPDCGCQHDG